MSCEAMVTIAHCWWQDQNIRRKDLDFQVNCSLLSVWHYGTLMTILNKTFVT